MGIIFRIRDFAYPFSMLSLRRLFEKNQWLGQDALQDYQSSRLKQIITHAYENVPYYQGIFRKNNIVPSDIQTVKDLQNLPILSKELLMTNFDSLIARNANKYKPVLMSTSGTTGERTTFYCDKSSNVLEFVYYWRFWNWAGYRLGDTFADLDVEFFPYYSKDSHALSHYSPLTGKLTLNSLQISEKTVEDFIGILRKHKPRFLKGIPSNLFMLSLILKERKDLGIKFEAIFSQGEMLLPHQRDLIEMTFACSVFDSYGQMERVTAISQCPSGTYHIHQDYGIAELEDPELPLDKGDGKTSTKEIIGTSLHNFSMPLIRYRTRDLVKVSGDSQKCPCGRGFSSVSSVIGRYADTVITPDKRAVTGLYLVFDHTPGIIFGQIIQEEMDQLRVKIVSSPQDADRAGEVLKDNLRNIVGSSMKLTIEQTTAEMMRKENPGKFKVVISRVPPEKIFS